MEVIQNSPHIQYLLELENLEYAEPANPRRDLTYAEKIKELWEHRTRLLHLNTAESTLIELGHYVSGWFIGGSSNLLLRMSGPRRYNTYRRLDFYRLASGNCKTTFESWSLTDTIGIEIEHVVADPESDLLVLFDRLYNPNRVRAQLRSLRPGADQLASIHTPTLQVLETSAAYRIEINANIVGKILAVTIQYSPSLTQFVIWDWTSGAQLTVSSTIRANQG